MAMTMGIVRVAFLTALVAGVPPVTITSTCDPTSSAAIYPILSPFPLEGDASSLDISKVSQTLHECLAPRRERRRRTRQEDTNTRHFMGLLRTRCERPHRSRATAEKNDELATLHSIESHAIPHITERSRLSDK